jgi:hypothetical protein
MDPRLRGDDKNSWDDKNSCLRFGSKQMKSLGIASLLWLGWMSVVNAQTTSAYCPANHRYITLGMSITEVVMACGEPTHKETDHQPYARKIPVLQLTYKAQGSSKAFYGVWTIPVGVYVGATLHVDIVDNKVYSVRVDGGDNKAFSICGGVPLVIGDPVSKVYANCGNPSVINDTYITKQDGPATYPEIWTYAVQYQPSLRLTFVRGKLEFIQ